MEILMMMMMIKIYYTFEITVMHIFAYSLENWICLKNVLTCFLSYLLVSFIDKFQSTTTDGFFLSYND